MPNKRILIIEDEAVIGQDLKQKLTAMGYEVPAIAMSGPQAIELSKKTSPDLLLVDIMLNGPIDGIETVSRIKQHKNIPFIYLTAYNDPDTLAKAKGTGPLSFLVKPYDARQLHTSIELAFHSHHLYCQRLQHINALEQQNSNLESILYTTIHDLRSPIINIQGFTCELSELLTELYADKNLSESQKQNIQQITNRQIPEIINFINAGTEKICMIIEGLSAISRLGTEHLNFEQIDMNHLINRILSSIQFELAKANVRIKAEPLPPCLGSAIHLDRAFTNLIDNAVKYLDPQKPGQITIWAKSEPDKKIYCIEDNGIGIPKARQKKIFDLFHRTGQKESITGFGIGLSIAKRIIQLHNGNLWLYSEPKKGSRFFVSLPT